MNKKLFLTTGIIACLGGFAYAQNTVTLTTGDQEITVNNTIKEPQLIPIELVRDPSTGRVIARLAATQNAGTALELGRMTLEGVTNETQMGDKKRFEIVWDTAAMIDEETGEKKTTPFTIPFKSEVVAKPTLEQGDEFNAEGDPIELMLAYQRLLQEKEKEEEEEEQQVAEEDTPDQSGAPSEKASEDERDFETPDFEVADEAEPVITTQACPLKVDMAQRVAIQMEETLVDGVSESGCQETLTRFPITAVTNGCSLSPDVDNMVMLQQERFVYTDPNAGEVQAQGCTDNPDLSIPITETDEGCGIFHDFDTGISTVQTKLVYEHQGVIQTLQTCQNSDTTYNHIVTRSGCSPIVNHTDGTVTFTQKTLIDVDGAQQEILGCLPDASSTIAINEEECTGGNRYTHNFDSNQSFLNKSYYYMDGGSRVDVITCQPSDVTFAHAIEESLCSDTHDDVNRITTMRGRPVIDDGGQVVVGSCEDIAPTIPYVEIGAQWQKVNTAVSNLQLDATDNSFINIFPSNSGSGDGRIPSQQASSFFRPLGGGHRCDVSRFNSVGKNKKVGIAWQRSCCGFGTGLTSPAVQGYAYCIRGEIIGNWTLTDGAQINKANSVGEPTFSQSVSGATVSPHALIGNCGGVNNYDKLFAANATINYNCSQPSATVTTLYARPLFQRGDLSEYLDTNTILDTMFVIGDGTNVDGTAY